MNNEELAEFLGIAGKAEHDRIMAAITPEKLALYEEMNRVEWELKLWTSCAGPKPKGVIVCRGCHD